MSDTFTLFKDKLNEIFQMDRAELDFGIYRIMNVKRREIERYVDEDLLKDELAKPEEQLTAAGVDPSSSPKVPGPPGAPTGEAAIRLHSFILSTIPYEDVMWNTE